MNPATDPEGPALVIIDVQQGFDDPRWGRRNNPDAEEHIGALLDAWRRSGRPVVHVQHASSEPDSPLEPDQPGFAFKPVVQPRDGEPVIRKQVNSAFIGTDLEEYLRSRGIEAVVVTGLTTDHCVSTTARMAENLGFDTTVVADATATFDRDGPGDIALPAEENHRAALAQLNGEFATIVGTEDLLKQLDDDGG